MGAAFLATGFSASRLVACGQHDASVVNFKGDLNFKYAVTVSTSIVPL